MQRDKNNMQNIEREKRHKRYTMFSVPETPANSPVDMALNNSNLEKKLSVSTILKDLELAYLDPIFIREEVSSVCEENVALIS